MRTKLLLLIPILLIPATLDALPAPQSAINLSVVSGNNQTALHGTRLPAPFTVRATDSSGNPVGGVPVRFEVASGGGAVNPTPVSTDVNGLAGAMATLGDALGLQQFQAIFTGMTGAPAQFLSISKDIALQPLLSGLTLPIFLGNARDGSNRRFLIEQPGRIRVLQPGASESTVFLDISSRVGCCGEQGLLGLAFHPQYSSNRRFFVNYTRAGDGATVIAEYRVSAANIDVADTTETVLLTVDQPFANHNGGMVAFGPDGYLYIGMGDGGSGNDPNNYAQNTGQLLGKMLRIDVNHSPYVSPSSNPFFGDPLRRNEIFAVGLRNPWRFSFDRATGQLYVGDVGQNAREEVDIVTLGGNYGWRVVEGTFCTNLGPAPCSDSFVPPIAEYGHDSGRCSITGGYVYRGLQTTFPSGAYLYGDYCTGEVFLHRDGDAERMILDTAANISSFGEDEAGELYLVDLNGTVNRLVASPETPALTGIIPSAAFPGDTFAVTLLGTGFVSGLALNTGSGITASATSVVSPTTVTAILSVHPGAVFGDHSITVTTLGGTSGAIPFTVVPPLPMLSAINPATGTSGTNVDVTLTGTNLLSPSITISGTGVFVSNITSAGNNAVTAQFVISPTANPGLRNVSITTVGGTTSPVAFNVVLPVPILTSIVPAVGAPGTSVQVLLTGLGFVNPGTLIGPISGMTIENSKVESATSMTATLFVDSGATHGAHSVRVTTPGGTSGSVEFTITETPAGPFPDLSISTTHTGNFGVGFSENYTIAVRNVGTLPTTGPMTVTDTLPSGMTFVSGTGTAWSCSASGQAVSCANASVLEGNGLTSILMTVTVGAAAAGNVAHTVAVATVGDLDASNDQGFDLMTVVGIPAPDFVFTPSPLAAGQQAALALTLATPFPHDISGTLTLAFIPDASVAIVDPAIQFASGGRAISFTIAADSGQARFGNASQAGPISFQPGTVAGTLAFAGTLQVGTIPTTFLAPAGLNGLTITRQPPAIQNIRTTLIPNGVAALITLFSTSREVTQLTVTFNTKPSVGLSCGSVPECSVAGNTITFNVVSLFAGWFQSDGNFGGLSTLRLPLSMRGEIHGMVSVTLRNNDGVSNRVSFPLP